ncbi:MAG: accessory factor UbiK family protein [Arsenophonus sp.]|nr:MAG: accessory factor UbiK family protein [Arsenophonus sp.]
MIDVMDKKKIEQIIFQIKKNLPQEIRDLGSDFEKKIHEILQEQLKKLNFVSKEKFNMHTESVLKIHKKMQCIENRLNKLEKRFKSKNLVTK